MFESIDEFRIDDIPNEYLLIHITHLCDNGEEIESIRCSTGNRGI